MHAEQPRWLRRSHYRRHHRARPIACAGARQARRESSRYRFQAENLDQAKAELQRDGVAALCLAADNRVVAEVRAAAAAAEAAFGKIDVLVNNAGISGMMASIEAVDETFFDNLFDTHVKGAFFAVQAVVP
jgi:3-oxoacyl-[acyl-carrier protein] reductase